jgi:hypothetical protein
MIFIIYLAVQERELKGLLERSQLGLLDELDSRQKRLGNIVKTHSQIGKLNKKFTQSFNI